MSSAPQSGDQPQLIEFTLNGKAVSLHADPLQRLSQLLRDHGETDTKVGCDAGDCGACSVLVDDQVVCSCLLACAQVSGGKVRTAAGLGKTNLQRRLKQAFLEHAATQCGICTPGMLVSAVALLEQTKNPTRAQVEDALGGVLCRCTGYVRIVDAVMSCVVGAPEATATSRIANDAVTASVGRRLPRLDGQSRVDATEQFAADVIPRDALWVRVVRSPHHSARFAFTGIENWKAEHEGVVAVFTAADIPGRNCFGVIPPFADQPVFAEQRVRFRGEAVAIVVGQCDPIRTLDLDTFPVRWDVSAPSLLIDQARGAALIHPHREDNILVRGLVQRGDAVTELSHSVHRVTGSYSTPFIEHGYIEPEAGYVRRVGERLEVHTCTQTAGMTRDDLASIMDLSPESVRVLPTAVGGGFGSKLDLSIQPLLCVAAWHLNAAVAGVYSRRETMQTTTKRHPSQISIDIGCDDQGQLTALDFYGDFNTGAYASWGPTVANRVPIHASGPFHMPHYRARTTAVHTHCAPAGAFRGFGVPQAAVALECSLDQLADLVGTDRLQFRLQNALRNGQPTVTGQVFDTGVGIADCLQALQAAWKRATVDAQSYNNQSASVDYPQRYRKGCGIATCWYGCGNTSLANPSTIKMGIRTNGQIVLHQGAIDLGQGAFTVIAQIAADALGVPLESLQFVGADTDLTPDAGKTSASRQTFVSGRAAELSARALRCDILRQVNASQTARIEVADGKLVLMDGNNLHEIDLAGLVEDEQGYVFCAVETFDPPTTPLDENGQGEPYAQYGYGAQMVELTVDVELGTIKLDRLTTAHDVGKAINPLLVEGQIEGGATQGIGMALMEEFVPGVSENLHDYLIPTFGDVPEFEHHIVEVADSQGPFGAKGLGEHVLIPTAPAILNAIRDATGAIVNHLPATPDKVLAAIAAVNQKTTHG